MTKGLILIDKPSGITSFKAVSKIKHIFGEKRVGHTGTLDPMATGVLPVFIGRATALSSYLLEADKTYISTFLFGKTTDTCDITGEVLSEKNVDLTKEKLDETLKKFTGVISQIPPMYSAIKKNGVPLYKLARRGEEVEIEPRDVEIYSVEVLKPLENNQITLKINCSKGTYIRSLCRDIGEYLGCGATVAMLRRIATSGFDIENCVSLDALTRENCKAYLLSEEKAVEYLREVNVTYPQAVRFTNGGELDIGRLKFSVKDDAENVRVKHGDAFLGIGRVEKENNCIKVKCVLMGSGELE